MKMRNSQLNLFEVVKCNKLRREALMNCPNCDSTNIEKGTYNG